MDDGTVIGKDEWADPHKRIQDRVDERLEGKEKAQSKKDFSPLSLSPELKKVEENLKFLALIDENPIEKDIHGEEVFGCETVDPLPLVYGDNIWNRSIYTVDELCDMHEHATLEQRMKYRQKKRKVDSKLMFLLLLLGLGGLCVMLLVFLLPMFMS